MSTTFVDADDIDYLAEDIDVEDFPDEGTDEASGEQEEEKEPFVSIFDILDAPRYLPQPVELTTDIVKEINTELGIITLCWPVLRNVDFEGRTAFPKSYLENNDKEKLLLLYAENFRRQFQHRFPDRKQLFLASDNECGLQKMVCTTIRPTQFPYPEIADWEKCSKFVGEHFNYEPLDLPTIIPSRLYSPHTTFIRQSGHSFEIATALCSLLIAMGYNTFVVSGYATQDVALRITTRVDCAYPSEEDQIEVKEEVKPQTKYALKPPRDLRSKFLLMMEQREIDKVKEEQRMIEEERRRQREEEEIPPFDELQGLRVHGWVLLLAGARYEGQPMFIEASTGAAHPADSPLYCGVESVWNHLNYWVNMQDCSDLANIKYTFEDVTKWEHLLPGEPLEMRQRKQSEDMYEEESTYDDALEEKHLDMPLSWSQKISIPHHVLKNRYPQGRRETKYKRTLVEEFAPYTMQDGLTVKIHRHDDLECRDSAMIIEEYYENRHDLMTKTVRDCLNGTITEYFERGRDDAVKSNSFNFINDQLEATRTIEFYHLGRCDGLEKLDMSSVHITEYYKDREDFFYYRHIEYAPRGKPPPGMIEGNRRIVTKITEKFHRNEEKPANKDVAVREFAIIDREIHLKYHYEKGKVTASTRDFIKPPVAEMGQSMQFHPELTFGYESEMGAKPPRKLQLFMLFRQLLADEEKSLYHVREMEDQIDDFLQLRYMERGFPKLEASLFNKEQNKENFEGMLERERQEREHREKEMEEDIDYLAPYLARIGNPESLTMAEIHKVGSECLEEFKQMMIKRANKIQEQFEKTAELLEEKQAWYTDTQFSLKPEEEEKYFEEVNQMIFLLHTLELRMNRHRDLSALRYQALSNYLFSDIRLQIDELNEQRENDYEDENALYSLL